MTIDDRLLTVLDKLTRSRKTTRSAFIRWAIEAEVRRDHVHELEVRHAQGYASKRVMRGEFDLVEKDKQKKD